MVYLPYIYPKDQPNVGIYIYIPVPWILWDKEKGHLMHPLFGVTSDDVFFLRVISKLPGGGLKYFSFVEFLPSETLASCSQSLSAPSFVRQSAWRPN